MVFLHISGQMNTVIGEIKRANDCCRLPILMQCCNKSISGITRKHAKQATACLGVKQRFNMRIKLYASMTVKTICINLHSGTVLVMQA